MGGSGSGRKCTNALTVDVFKLDIRTLEKHELLKACRTGRMRVTSRNFPPAHLWTTFEQSRLILYLDPDLGRDPSGKRVRRLVVEVRWTPCHLGGKRPWFLCPGKKCSRRALILYGEQDFLCRRCRRVSYPMQRIAPISRPTAQIQSIRLKLGGSQDMTVPFPEKPKGMHLHKYIRLWRKSHELKVESNARVEAWFQACQARRNQFWPRNKQ